MKFRWILSDSDDELPPKVLASAVTSAHSSSTPPVLYEIQGENLVRRVPSPNGRRQPVILANFRARIVGDILVDDGVDATRRFVLEAGHAGQKVTFELSAAEFARMQWVLPRLGPRAIIYPGQQQHVRAAIQYLSGAFAQQRIFTHLGWRQDGEHWVYLHAGGVLAAPAAASRWQVRLRAPLQHYRLHAAAQLDESAAAVRASLRLLDAAADRITVPLLAAVYRALLGAPSFSLFVSGPSGMFKSALAAVCQQHFGAAMDAAHLPANFASTGNALEWLAFAAKDVLLVVDDFAPTGGCDAELEAVAERLFRAAGNQQGRHRLAGAGCMVEPRAPRGLVLATGETVPTGQSLRARLLVVEVGPGDVRPGILRECQRDGQAGLLARAMATFVKWVAARYPEIQAWHCQRVEHIRDRIPPGARHARTPAAVAELQSAWEIFLRFAAEGGFITADEQDALARRGALALAEVSETQAAYQQPADAALRFLALLQVALAGGIAHVADRRGRRPERAEAWGWRRTANRSWQPRGIRIGWLAGLDLYLDPATSFEVAQRQAGAVRLDTSPQRLRQLLRKRGLLASLDVGRHMLQVRRTLGGMPRQVLHLRAADVCP